jgi:predicted nucleic acid-binding protein
VAVIVDTDVVSFILKKDSRAALYRPHLEGLPKIISFMTLAELRRWELQNNWGARRVKETREFLDDFTIVHSDEKLCEIWAEIRCDAHKYGNPIDTADAWVASVARLFDVPLVTNNRRHFENVKNLKIISES